MATRRHIDGIMHPPGTGQKETPVMRMAAVDPDVV
jgi:hypothetical protein